MRRLIGIVAVFCFVLWLAARGSPQGQPAGDPRISYKYGTNMRFGVSILKDAAGQPVNKRLTFSADGSTNSTVVRIDGKDVEYGGLGGKWVEKEAKFQNGTRSVWSIGGVEIAQILEVRPGKEGHLDTLLVRYVVENKDGKPHNVGVRVQLDSLIGSNDGVPFIVAGSPDLVTTFKDFPNAASVPEWVEALETANVKNPGTVAHMTLKLGGNVEAPGRASITRWPGSGFIKWDVPLTNFGGDSSLVLYWNEAAVGAGQKRDMGFSYGTKVAPSAGGGPGMKPGNGTGTPVAGNPWDHPQGQVCFERWIAEAMGRLNRHKGGADFNGRKPWSINRYGVLEGNPKVGPTSVAAPDNFAKYNYNKYWWMWDNWVQDANGRWRYPEWNDAGVPSLRDFVTKCVGDHGGTFPAPVTRMTLQAPHLRVRAGDFIQVPIWLLNGADVANMNFTVHYDGAIALPEPTVTKGNLLGGASFRANTKPPDPNQALIGFAQTTGINGTGTVAYLTFRAIGKPGQRTPLYLQVTTINNPGGTVLPIDLIHGSILIVGPDGLIPGDCDGDGALTALDALCALEMSVKLIPVRMNMDIDADGQVTSRDAVLILQRAVQSIIKR